MKKAKVKEAVDKLKERLINRFGNELEIYLFGSVARGDSDKESDIDILVLVPFELNNSLEEEIFDIAYDIELEHGVVFGMIVYSKDYWYSQISQITPLYKNVKKEGVAV